MVGNAEFPVVHFHPAILLRLTSPRKGFNGLKRFENKRCLNG